VNYAERLGVAAIMQKASDAGDKREPVPDSSLPTEKMEPCKGDQRSPAAVIQPVPGPLWSESVPEIGPALYSLWRGMRRREAELVELIARASQSAGGRPRCLPRPEWGMALTKTIEAVVDFARATLVLYAGSPDADFVGLQVSGLVYEMCVVTWRRVIANAECEPGPLGVDAQAYTDTCAVLAARKVRAIAALAKQEPSSPASQPAPEPEPVSEPTPEPGARLIPRERFDAFIENVRRTGRRLNLGDIDHVAGYSRSTREDLEAGNGNPRSYARYASVLHMEPSAFIDALENR
jgi:hypothetical protein